MQLASYYRNILGGGPSYSDDGIGLESSTPPDPDLSSGAISDRLDLTRAELQRIVKDHLGDRPALHELAAQILANGADALRMVRDDDSQALSREPDFTAALEAIVRTDGSRPSFMIRNGQPDRTTSPLGNWADYLTSSEDLLHDAISCVGRIDTPQGADPFAGTGFLIHENLILTNRHVLQSIARQQPGGAWKFYQGVSIDFGHEFRAAASIAPRALKRLVFTGAQQIGTPIDHSKLDLALIELEPAPAGQSLRAVLSLDSAPDWPDSRPFLCTIGYPANPGPLGYTPTLLEQLFQSTYGYKRLAPGMSMTTQATHQRWTTGHDATTLGGNSGSVVVVAGRERAAAGLHYGGRRGAQGENWALILGQVLSEPDAQGVSFLTHLKSFGVQFNDRTTS